LVVSSPDLKVWGNEKQTNIGISQNKDYSAFNAINAFAIQINPISDNSVIINFRILSYYFNLHFNYYLYVQV